MTGSAIAGAALGHQGAKLASSPLFKKTGEAVAELAVGAATAAAAGAIELGADLVDAMSNKVKELGEDYNKRFDNYLDEPDASFLDPTLDTCP